MKANRGTIAIAALALASLACNAFANTADRLVRQANAPKVSTEANGNLRVGAGPVITSLENTRQILQAQGDSIQLLEAYAPERYTSEELSLAGHTYTYTVTLPAGTTALWGTNWCTTTAALLEDNWQHIRLEFVVNGATIPLDQFGVAEVQSDNLYCRHVLTTASDWPPGQTVLETHVTFSQKINDGISDYPAGTHVYQYTVTAR